MRCIEGREQWKAVVDEFVATTEDTTLAIDTKSVSWLPGRSDSIEGSSTRAGLTSRTVPRSASSNRIGTGPLLAASGAVVGVGTVVVPSLDTVSSVVVTAEDVGEAGDVFAPVTADGAECFAAQPANRRTATAGPRAATRPTTRGAN